MAEKHEKSHDEQVKELRKLIEDIKFGMFTTAEKDGSMRSRPMVSRKIEDDGVVWFFTYDNDGKIDEIKNDYHVNVTFSEPKSQKYVSLSGKATLVKDKTKMEELWNPTDKAWFPKGLEEPHIGLLKVTVDKAEYWDCPNSMLVRLVSFTKAILTGRTAENLGTHEKVTTNPLTAGAGES